MEIIKHCPECGGEHFFVNKNKGEIICKQCSFVVEDAMPDFGKERMIDSEDFAKNSRTGAPFDPRVADNLITDVGSKEDLGRLNAKTRMLMQRIRKRNRWTSSSLQQNFNANLGNLKLISSSLNLPDRIEKESARIYRESVERGITRARSNDNILAASVYIASKIQDMPKTLNEVATASQIDKFTIARTAKLIMKGLGIKLLVSNPIDFIERFGSEIDLEPIVQTKSIKLIERMKKAGVTSGKNPASLAATAIYLTTLMTNTRVTQKKISEVSGITETTLRNRTKEMIAALKIKRSELKRRRKISVKKK